MSKKTIRIISVVLTMAITLMVLTSTIFAYNPNDVDTHINTSANGINKIESIGGSLLGVIQVIGTIVAVGIVMVLGIKYMMGSAEEKASYKKTMLPYIIGAVLLFAASNLAQYVFNFAEGI